MNKPTKIYAEYVEHEAMEQFRSAMEQDYVLQGALMPDAHTGYTLPIGAVVACDSVIVPAYVGYDIGCGMCALPTTYDKTEVKEKAKEIFDLIYQKVPVGNNLQAKSKAAFSSLDTRNLTKDVRGIFSDRGGFHALGTLGGGNHFIELGADNEGKVWIIIHSGSRGVGHGIATYYMKLASGDGKAREGHFGLKIDSPSGQAYINDLAWCLQFALENRLLMITEVNHILEDMFDGEGLFKDLINRNHNHAELKDGRWIHRKGATHAELGMKGVIPGNMRDGSFIVEGLGNPESMSSSSHGAGRVLGRAKAKANLDLELFELEMDGIVAKVGASTLDESPGAYKDIFEVMRLQKDLVNVITHVKPIINIKG